MEKVISHYCYWLGLLCAAIALVLRGLNALGVLVPHNPVIGVTIWYMSFYKGALLFLLVTIATANFAWFRGQKP